MLALQQCADVHTTMAADFAIAVRTPTAVHNREDDELDAVQCQVCLDVVPGSRMVQLGGCEHAFCSTCVAKHVSSRAAEDCAISCLAHGCATILAPPRRVSAIDEADTCAICLCCEGMAAGDTTTLHCGHSFHSGCIARWLKRSGQCPTCRAFIQAPDAEGPGESAQRQKEEEELTQQFLRDAGFRSCGQCSALIEKAEGCNKMQCRCGYRFCFACGCEGATCVCTPYNHGFINNVTGRAEFATARTSSASEIARRPKFRRATRPPTINIAGVYAAPAAPPPPPAPAPAAAAAGRVQ